MGINSVGSYYTGNYAKQSRNRLAGRNSSVSNGESMGKATSPLESSDNGKRTGLTISDNVQYIVRKMEKWNKVRSYSDTDAIDNIKNVAQMIPVESGEEGVARLEHGIKKIVRTINPEDGKEYVTYFTKNDICCKWMEGDNEVSWTMDITEEQYALIDKYFDRYNSGNKEEQLWYSGDEFGMVSSKEYWLGFFEGAEVSDENYMDAIREQIEEMQEKIKNGEINETFQVGGQSFTVEEWNEFLEKFDSIQEVLEALMKERHKLQEKEKIENEMAKKDSEDEVNGEDRRFL